MRKFLCLPLWIMALFLAIPMGYVVVIGGWSITDPFELPWWYWAYCGFAALSIAYIQTRYFDKI